MQDTFGGDERLETSPRILIFGNSGAGKSTLARHVAHARGLAHLDLDALAWLPDMPPRRRPLDDSRSAIALFTDAHPAWVIEGCYGDLLEMVLPSCTELIFLNPGTEACLANCRARPWEPHKYPSRQAQDANLPMLLEWVRAYASRSDEFSLARHRAIFDGFAGVRREIRHKRVLDGSAGSTSR
jgi:adenylate kinase family enzyme